MEIEGQAAIVSGGASGLGRATAKALAESAVKVTILDINSTAAADAAREIGGFSVGCEVADAASVEAAFVAARQHHGPARIAINCAGIATAGRIVGRDGPLPLDVFRRVIDVNLIGSFNVMRVAATEMSSLDPLADGERGIIVSTASAAAYEGQIGQAAYSASKGGIVALTLPAARELARYGVRVVAIASGRVRDTDAAKLATGRAGHPRCKCAVPEPARPARGIRRAGASAMPEYDDQRRSHTARWRAAHGAALSGRRLRAGEGAGPSQARFLRSRAPVGRRAR